MAKRGRVDSVLREYLEGEGAGAVIDPVDRDDCEKKHEKLDKEVEKAIEMAMASVEARIKVWIAMGLIAILGTIIYFLVELGSYRNQVDIDAKRIEKLEQTIDQLRYDKARDGGSGGRAP